MWPRPQSAASPTELAPVWYKTVARPTTTTVTASTSAHPAWTRGIAYDWTVRDTVGSSSVSLGRGQSASVTTTLAAIRTATSEANRYGASGQVCVTNGGALATEGLNIVQRLQYRSGAAAFAELAGTRTVITPVEQIAAGESRCFPYQAEFTPVAQATYRSLATITISNYDGHGGEAYGPEASAEFGIPATPSTTANDGQARLSHAVSCPAGFTCTPDDAGPWDLSGSRSLVVTMSIENVSGACDGVAEVASGATLVEGTSAEQRSASAVVSVATGSCPLSGCTRGHGYWKTHPERIAPLLPVSLGAGGTNGMTLTDSSAAVEILEMKTYGGPSNGITKLYAQLLTAKLNAAAGADTSRIAATIQSADAFLATHDYGSWARLGASARNEILGWMETLDAYNNGKMGPGVCTEPASPVKATVAAKKPVTQAQATKNASLPKATGNQQTKKASKKLPTVPLSWLAR